MINGFRFIIGNGCNLRCFYCHHEGVFKEEKIEDFAEKIDYIYRFCCENNITNLSITGGEPLLYKERLLCILDKFNNEKFNFSINTNGVLIDKYIDCFDKLNQKIEFHINLSSLKPETHKKITGTDFLPVQLSNLEKIKKTKLKICLNCILLKSINDDEINDLIQYSKDRDFMIRFLQYLPNSESDKSLVITEKDLKNYITDLNISEINSYGIFNCEKNGYNFQFVKNLCCEKMCERCKKNTYIHFTPELNVKKCMMKKDVDKLDYLNYNKFETQIFELDKELNNEYRS